MYFNGTVQLTTKVDRYDGYCSKPIWRTEGENESTYDNVWMDNQGSVPVEDIDVIKRELGL